MKKLFLLAALGFALTACSNTSTEVTPEEEDAIDEVIEAGDAEEAEANEVNGNDAVEENSGIDESVAEPEDESLNETLEGEIEEVTGDTAE